MKPVLTCALALLVPTGSAFGFSFNEDPDNGSILLTTFGGELVWLVHDPQSQIQGGPCHNFNVSADFGITDRPKGVTVTDFDGDLNGDAIVVRSGPLPQGMSTWVERFPQMDASCPNDALTGVHNFNVSPALAVDGGEMGDGLFDDFVVSREDGTITWCYKNPGSSQITAYHNFNVSADGGLTDQPKDLVICDFDGDADGDVLVARSGGVPLDPTTAFVTWVERTPSNTLTGVHNFNVGPSNSITAGDANNDGLDDVFIGRDDGWVVWVFKAPGSDSITSTHAFNAGGVTDLAFGDAGNDCVGDVFVIRPDGNLLWLRANPAAGNLNAVDTELVAGFGASLTTIDVGNFDGDDTLDIIIGRDEGVGTGSVTWYEADHTTDQIVLVQGFFAIGTPPTDLELVSVMTPPPTCPTVGCLGDLNCDTTLDGLDVGPFTLALTDAAGYASSFPACDINNADMNADTFIDDLDIAPFVAAILAGGACP